jgi:RNase P/RNase MRP subunit p29
MNVIGERLTVLTSADPTKTGRSGRVLIETERTLLLDTGVRKIMVEKSGCAFMLLDSGRVITRADINGRLQDRLGREKA